MKHYFWWTPITYGNVTSRNMSQLIAQPRIFHKGEKVHRKEWCHLHQIFSHYANMLESFEQILMELVSLLPIFLLSWNGHFWSYPSFHCIISFWSHSWRILCSSAFSVDDDMLIYGWRSWYFSGQQNLLTPNFSRMWAEFWLEKWVPRKVAEVRYLSKYFLTYCHFTKGMDFRFTSTKIY